MRRGGKGREGKKGSEARDDVINDNYTAVLGYLGSVCKAVALQHTVSPHRTALVCGERAS